MYKHHIVHRIVNDLKAMFLYAINDYLEINIKSEDNLHEIKNRMPAAKVLSNLSKEE